MKIWPLLYFHLYFFTYSYLLLDYLKWRFDEIKKVIIFPNQYFGATQLRDTLPFSSRLPGGGVVELWRSTSPLSTSSSSSSANSPRKGITAFREAGNWGNFFRECGKENRSGLRNSPISVSEIRESRIFYQGIVLPRTREACYFMCF